MVAVDFYARLKACGGCAQNAGGTCALLQDSIARLARETEWRCPHQPAQTTPQRLAVVASLFNPMGYRALADNWRHWRASMQPLLDAGRITHCLTAEAVWSGQSPTVDPVADIIIPAAADQLLWQKERLLNIAIEALPADVDAVAWIDPDVHFLNPDWPETTRERLARFPVVQLFERVVLEEELNGAVQVWPATATRPPGPDRYKQPHKPGYAWSARREVIAATGGLFDAGLSGSGDLYMLYAWLGSGERAVLPHLYEGEPMLRHWQRWAAASAAVVQGRVGYVPGTIVHRFHGTRATRKYVERHEVARAHQYDPTRHIELAPNGLYRWTDPAGGLAVETAAYFAQRNDDHGRR